MKIHERVSWVVETPEGFLGQRNHSYSGGSSANRKAAFKFARIFARKADAKRSTTPVDKVVPVAIITLRNND